MALGLGSIAYFFGPELLHIYSEQEDVIACGMEILSYTTMTYFLCGLMDLFPGGFERNGLFHSAYDPVYYRNCRHADSLDLWTVPDTPVTGISVYLISGFLDCNHCDAGDLLLVCEKKDSQGKRRLLLSIDIIETYDS